MYNNEDMVESYIDDVCYYDEGHSNTNDIRIVSDPHTYFYPYKIVIPLARLNGANGGLGVGIWCTQNLDELLDETVDVESGPYKENYCGEYETYAPDEYDYDDCQAWAGDHWDLYEGMTHCIPRVRIINMTVVWPLAWPSQ